MSIITDFADIRSRMLGDDKPAPKIAEKPICGFCAGGWIKITSAPALTCPFCNPLGLRPCP